MVFVNPEKLERAEFIVGLVVGGRIPLDNNQRERADRFSRLLQEAKIDVKDKKGAVEFVYAKLGGLMRSEAEHKVAEAKREEAKTTAKKRRIEH